MLGSSRAPQDDFAPTISFVGAFLEITERPNVEMFGAVLGNSRASRPPGRGSPVTLLPWIAGLLFTTQMKYIEKHFTLRIHRKDGTAKLLLGVTGSPPKIGAVKEIKVAKDEVLKVKVVDHPRRDEPAEAIEV
jgi:hypothetical protein